MDPGTIDKEPRRNRSFSQESSAGSSLRYSLSLSRTVSLEINDEVNSENVSEAGDMGDRSLRRRHSIGRSSRLSADGSIEQGTVFPVPERDILQSYGFWVHDPRAPTTTSVTTPLPQEIVSPLATNALLPSQVEKQEKEEEPVLSKSLEYISCLIHLSVFGIFGVLTRYLLQKLFGPTVARVTSDKGILYLDLPSNMVGSFLMGWFGVVFKADIARVSEFLAIGLSTGYLGSLTTFSGWNQKMLDLAANGQWVYCVVGFLLGLFLAAYSIILGIETAKGFRWLLLRRHGKGNSHSCPRVKSFRSHMVCLTVMLLILVSLLSVSAFLLKEEFGKGTTAAQLWLGCIVASPGVWIRWFLARLNGRGLGKGRRLLKWVPFGTLIANVSAACVMAALSTLNKAVKTRTCNTVTTGIQFGLLGCLSTVSTLMAEFNAMRESNYPWRAYVYAFFTIGVSFTLGIFIYSIPIWVIRFS